MLNLNRAGAQSAPNKSSMTTMLGSVTYLDLEDLGESSELGDDDGCPASAIRSQYAVEFATDPVDREIEA